MAKICEGISLQQLIDGGAEFEVELDNADELAQDSDDGDIQEVLEKFTNMDVLLDEDSYTEGEPFEIIGRKMKDLIADGGIKKRIMREGHGVTPPDLSSVKVDYNAYVEYEAQPFDSTYCRKRTHDFIVNNSDVIPGLDIAVQSMLLGEKSQFLIKPNYAYGAMGCLGRVPKNATILFEIELHEIIDSGAAIAYHKLPEEKKLTFEEVYKYCLSLCERGKNKFSKNQIRESLKEYNTAAGKLETVELKDYKEQTQQQDLLLRIYTNILVCYTSLEEKKKGCSTANRIHELLKGTGKKASAKVYFCEAKCLRLLGDYTRAKQKLEIALRLEPKNTEIANEYLCLQNDKKKYEKGETQMAKAFMGSLGKTGLK